jgi:hypothetical protein
VACLVRFHSRAAEIRPGGRNVGTCVFNSSHNEEGSRFAEIYDTEDDGEPEVTSSPECPGAPRKASRNEFFS